MKAFALFLAVVGIICFAAVSASAISSEPVYGGNPEEYLKIELTKLGFAGLAISKEPGRNTRYSISAKNFMAETAVYANVLKDTRTAAQKMIPIIFKAKLRFIKGVKNPNILLRKQKMQAFGLMVSLPTYKIFKFL